MAAAQGLAQLGNPRGLKLLASADTTDKETGANVLAAISDIYAMGGEPRFSLSFAGFPRSVLPMSVLEQITAGAAEVAAKAGAPIIGRFSGFRSGHATNNALLRALFADDEAWLLDEMRGKEALTAVDGGFKAEVETAIVNS